jgi:hypothetical protein
MSDPDHEALYAAELAAFDGTDLEQVQPFAAITAVLQLVVDGVWWPAGDVDVRRTRADAGASSTRCAASAAGGRATISLAAPQMTVATAAHELAHVLAGPGRGHDAMYRRAYLDTVWVMTNIDPTDRRMGLHVEQLSSAFAAAGLGVGERSWPAPAEGTGSAFAL